MKVTFHSFKTANGNKVFSSNAEVINKYTISEDGLKTAIDIAEHQEESVFDLLSHKKMFITIPHNNIAGKPYETIMCFVVKTSEGLKLWSKQYLDIEDKDVIFTEKDEADALRDKHNDYSGLLLMKEYLENFLETTDDEILKISKELGK